MILLAKRALALNAVIKIAGAVLALGSHVVLARALGASQYGVLVTFVTQCSLLSIFVLAGLETTTVKLSADAHARADDEGARALFVSALSCVGLLLLLTIAGYAAMRIMIGQYTGQAVASVSVIAAAVGLLCAATVIAAVARGREQVLASDTVEAIVKPLLVTVLIAVSTQLLDPPAGAGAAIPAFVAAQAGVAAALLYVVGRCLRAPLRAKFRGWLGYMKMLLDLRSRAAFVLSGLLGFAFFQLDTLLVSVYWPSAEVGAYNMACNFVRLVIFVPLILVGQAQPQLAARWSSDDRTAFFATLDLILLRGLFAAALASIVLLVAGPWLLTKTNAAFAEAGTALRILAVAHVVNSATILISAGLYMAGFERDVLRAQFLGAAAATALYFALIPGYGSVGAAGAAAVGMLIMAGSLLQRYARMRRQELPP